MKLLKGIGTGLSLTLLCLLVTAKTEAQQQDSKTVVTLSAPLAVPGLGAQTLPAGTYIFKTLNSSSDRDIIQISSQDGSHVFATILGVPNSRLKASDASVSMFDARPAGEPQALKAWFGSGRTSGDQIVYEKPMATQLAKEANEPVLSTTSDMTNPSVDTLKAASIGAISASGEAVAESQVVDVPTAVAPAMAASATPAASPDATVVATTPAASPDTSVAATTPAASPDATVTATAPAASPDATVVATTPTAPTDSTVNATTPAASPDTTAVATTDSSSPSATPMATTEPADTSTATDSAEPAEPVAQTGTSKTLPKTASFLPLIGLGGLLTLGAGFLLTGLLKRNA